jgi:hypothetical protein
VSGSFSLCDVFDSGRCPCDVGNALRLRPLEGSRRLAESLVLFSRATGELQAPTDELALTGVQLLESIGPSLSCKVETDKMFRFLESPGSISIVFW